MSTKIPEKGSADFAALVASSLGNDLRTPLLTILANLDTLQGAATGPVNPPLLKIREAAGALFYRINSLVDLGLCQKNQLALQKKTFHTRPFLTMIEQVIGFLAVLHNTQFVMHIDEDIPESLVGDEQRISEILLTLIERALLQAQQGAILVVVENGTLSATQVNLCLAITATDPGGMSEQNRSLGSREDAVHFSFVHSGENSPDLGLVFELAQLMGGNISVTTKPGKGSKLVCTLPLERPRYEEKTPSTPAPEKKSEESSRYHSLRILVVDDVQTNRLVLERALTRFGHQVVLAKGGAEAIERFGDGVYDLVLMDISMPEVDGFAATKRIREMDVERVPQGYTPVIAVTAHNWDENWPEPHTAGFDDVINKPIDISKLKSLFTRNKSAGHIVDL